MQRGERGYWESGIEIKILMYGKNSQARDLIHYLRFFIFPSGDLSRQLVQDVKTWKIHLPQSSQRPRSWEDDVDEQAGEHQAQMLCAAHVWLMSH